MAAAVAGDKEIIPLAAAARADWVDTLRCPATDVEAFGQALRRLAPQRGLQFASLGQVGAYPLLLLEPRQPVAAANILVAAGFHGEEVAGCWGLVHFLDTAPAALFQAVNLAFLPLVNPTGFRVGRRHNAWGENANLGFCPASVYQAQPSREGQILLDHLPRLKALGRDGFLSLHEDLGLEKFYLFTFERTPQPGLFTQTLYQAARRFFEPQPDGPLEDTYVENGLVYGECDGTFEDRLFHEGLPRTACTETPGLADLNLRIRANAALLTAFVEYTASGGLAPAA